MRTLVRLLAVVCLSTSITNAQTSTYFPFPTDSANWDVQHMDFVNLGFGCVSTYHYGMRGDTMISGQSYNKIYGNNQAWSVTDTAFNMATAYYACSMREDSSRKIWAIHPADSIELLLYDFNLTAGDSFNYPYFQFSNTYFPVIGNDSMLVGGNWHKTVELFAPGGQDRWIEGVGAIDGLLQRAELSSWADYLRCFSVYGQQLWGLMGVCHCDAGLGLHEHEFTKQIRLFPNPAAEEFNLELPATVTGENEIRIYNSTGALVKQKTFLGHQTNYELTGLSNGMYWVTVITSDGVLYVQRLIKSGTL